MLRTAQNKPNFMVSLMVDRIMAAGQLSRREHLQLTSAILADHRIADEERHQINRIFDYIQIGRIKFID
ncbi:MAG: hypothetical protein ACM37W_20710 [Actinomycetota bacterium]